VFRMSIYDTDRLNEVAATRVMLSFECVPGFTNMVTLPVPGIENVGVPARPAAGTTGVCEEPIDFEPNPNDVAPSASTSITKIVAKPNMKPRRRVFASFSDII
jgi:hypothetical protein